MPTVPLHELRFYPQIGEIGKGNVNIPTQETVTSHGKVTDITLMISIGIRSITTATGGHTQTCTAVVASGTKPQPVNGCMISTATIEIIAITVTIMTGTKNVIYC